jgi:hypothetical protein
VRAVLQPFRCYLSSAFVRPPLTLSASLVPYSETDAKATNGKPAKSRETAVPAPTDRPAAAMVDGQLVALSTALSTAKATHRWPSAHTCQFKSAFSHENVYVGKSAPPCRWRSCLLPSHNLEARHTLVGGAASVYVLTQSLGAHQAIDEVACCEVVGGGAWRPPQTFVALRPGGRTPQAIDGFGALYTPAVEGVREYARTLPVASGGGEYDEDAPPPPPPPAEGEGEEVAPPPIVQPPCLWLLGGARADGLFTTLDMYNLEEVSIRSSHCPTLTLPDPHTAQSLHPHPETRPSRFTSLAVRGSPCMVRCAACRERRSDGWVTLSSLSPTRSRRRRSRTRRSRSCRSPTTITCSTCLAVAAPTALPTSCGASTCA